MLSNAQKLKKHHLSVFDKKRQMHRNLVSNLYLEYISGKNTEDDKWILFGDFYRYFAENFTYEIYEDEQIVGTNWHWLWQDNIEDSTVPGNGGHFIADFEDFINKGIAEKINELTSDNDAENSETLGIKMALNALSCYIKNYAASAKTLCEKADKNRREQLTKIAADCEFISQNPPESFRQALQLVWFVQSFLNMEAGSAAISFGRADMYLYPYFKKDIEKGVITPVEAMELIMCFYIKVSEGDESAMLTVGGSGENELTGLFIEAQTHIDMRQPSIALRFCDKTSEDILNKTNRLVQNGGGMPAYFNDDVVIKGLKMLGIGNEDAQNYGIVGCYEAAPQGAFSNTVAAQINLCDSFGEFLKEEKDYHNFEDFLNSYKKHFEAYYTNSLLDDFKERAKCDINRICPFASCVLNKKEGYIFGINILGIGVIIDSIFAIKKLVFDQKYTTIQALKENAGRNFDNAAIYGKLAGLKDHYGSNSPESNMLAKEISEFIGVVVKRHSIGEGIISSPALFWFTADIWQRNYPATINGRRQGELLSYGIMPCASPVKEDITSTLMSCANIAAEFFPDGCPAMIGIDKKDIKADGILGYIIKTYFSSGGFHLAVNAVGAAVLKKAKLNPEQYPDVMVKISGYSTQFTKLDENVQNAVIERAAK